MQRLDQHFLHMGLLSHNNKPTQYAYVEGALPLYMSYACPEQIKQGRHPETPEAYKGQRIKR